jgi:hypothetical protein
MAVLEDICVEDNGYKNQVLLPAVVRISSESLQKSTYFANREVCSSVFSKHSR